MTILQVQTILSALLAVLFLLLTGYLALRQPSASNATQCGIVLLSAALCIFVANIPHLESMKASVSGFEATTRKVEEAVGEAKATVAALTQLATALGEQQVNMVASYGRLAGEDHAQRWDRQKAAILEKLRPVGLSEQQLAAVESADREWVIVDYALAVLSPLSSRASSATARDEYSKAFQGSSPPTPDECQSLLDHFEVSDIKVRELLEDYRFYVATGRQRRPSVWATRGKA